MRDIVESTIKQYDLIRPGDSVLVAISGGPDSVALLYVLMSLAPSMDFRVSAAHLNHGIRDEAADSDEAFVRELCEFMGVPLYVERADVPAIAKEKGWTLEQAGREERYAFFHRIKAEMHADRIAVAHHMDDQAESILLHLTRGTGLAGLVGMVPMRDDIIRPLLFVRRGDVEEYLSEEGLAYCVDASNLETGSTRNRLRLDLIPYVEEYINPAFVDTLCSMGELLFRDESYLQQLAHEALEGARCGNGFERGRLRTLPLPLLTRALREALREAGAKTDIERVHIERLIELLDARTGARLQLPGLEAGVSYDLLYFGSGSKEEIEPFELPLVVPGTTKTPLGSFVSEYVPAPESFGNDRNIAYVDARSLSGAVIRLRRDGDRIYPVGAPGRKKLKDYFIDRKVPRSERVLPLLCKGEEALFVPGFCTAEQTRITAHTKEVLRIEYIPKEAEEKE